MWWKKNKGETSELQSKLADMVSLLNVRMVKLEAEVDTVQQGLKVLRGFVNAKLKLEPDVEVEPEEEEEPEADSDGFDELRALRKQYH